MAEDIFIEDSLSSEKLRSFFRTSIKSFFEDKRVSVSYGAVSYVGNVMANAYRTCDFYRTEKDNLDKKPLAFVLDDVFSGDSFVKHDKLKVIGDFSLLMSGFFQDYLLRQRRANLLDYYTSMGASAYDSLSSLVRSNSGVDLFSELSERFVDFRDILRSISLRAFPSDAESNFKLFTQWISNQDPLIEAELDRRGISMSKQ